MRRSGTSCSWNSRAVWRASGSLGKADFWIATRGEPQTGIHVAFVSPDHETVDRFYEAAIAAGGVTTAHPGRVRSITRTTTVPTSSTPTGTTWKRAVTRPGNRGSCCLDSAHALGASERRAARDSSSRRTIARERIAPRAAEIDASHEFPRTSSNSSASTASSAPLRRGTRGHRHGTLLALVAIEEGLQGLCDERTDPCSAGARLTRSPSWRAMPSRRSDFPQLDLRRILAAYALTEAGSGSDSAAMRTTRAPGRRVRPRRLEAVHHERVGRARVHGLREDRPGRRACRHLRVRRRGRHPGFEVARLEPKMGISGSTTRQPFEAPASPPRTSSERRARASRSRCACSTARARESPPKASGSPRCDRLRARVRPARSRGRRWASRSPTIRLVTLSWRTWTAMRGRLPRSPLPLRAHGRRGRPERPATSAMAKLCCTDTAMWVATEAVQILGGYGYMQGTRSSA